MAMGPVGDRPRAVLGILGMPGSGKSVLAELLRVVGVPAIRLGGFVVDEIKAQGLVHNPANEAIVRQSLRAAEGEDVLAKRAIEWLEGQPRQGFFVFDGVYSPIEDEYIRKRSSDGYFSLAVVCDKALRYQRLSGRVHRPLTLEQAVERDRHEIAMLRKSEPIIMADYFVTNNSDAGSFLRTSLESIFSHLQRIGADRSLVESATLSVSDLVTKVAAGDVFGVESRWVVLARAQLEQDPALTWHVCKQLGELGDPSYTPFLVDVLGRPDRPVADSSLHQIGEWALSRTGTRVTTAP